MDSRGNKVHTTTTSLTVLSERIECKDRTEERALEPIVRRETADKRLAREPCDVQTKVTDFGCKGGLHTESSDWCTHPAWCACFPQDAMKRGSRQLKALHFRDA